MSIPAEQYQRMEEYENFQKTNLEYYPENYEEWEFARNLKESREKNAPINEKVSKFATTTFYKFLVAISRGNKQKAMNIKMSILDCAFFISFNRRQLSQDKVIQGIALIVFFCLRACLFIDDYKKMSINFLTNITNYLE